MLAQLTATLTLPKSLNAACLLVLLPKGKMLPGDVTGFGVGWGLRMLQGK